MRPGVWSLVLAGACLFLLASASFGARPAHTAAGVTFTLVGSPKCATGETHVGQGCFRNVQGDKLTVGSASTSGSADYSSKPSEGGAQWKDHFTWHVPQKIVAGTKIAGGIQLAITVSNVQPEQPLSQGIKGFAPGFAEQIIANYPAAATASKSFDYTLFASATSGFTITIEFMSSTLTYHYAPSGNSCRVFASAAGATAEACLESFRFAVAAHHPARVRAPTGRKTNEGWVLKGGNVVSMMRPHLSYYESTSVQDPAYTRGALIDLKVTDADLTESGPSRVVKLKVTVIDNAEGNPAIDKIVRCRAGSHGTIVLIDDNRLVKGADNGQIRDKVLVTLPPCPYFSHTYSNEDSFLHEPFNGGEGQRANVIVKTSDD